MKKRAGKHNKKGNLTKGSWAMPLDDPEVKRLPGYKAVAEDAKAFLANSFIALRVENGVVVSWHLERRIA